MQYYDLKSNQESIGESNFEGRLFNNDGLITLIMNNSEGTHLALGRNTDSYLWFYRCPPQGEEFLQRPRDYGGRPILYVLNPLNDLVEHSGRAVSFDKQDLWDFIDSFPGINIDEGFDTYSRRMDKLPNIRNILDDMFHTKVLEEAFNSSDFPKVQFDLKREN